MGQVSDELHLILVIIYAPNVANQQVRFFKELENQFEDLKKYFYRR